MTVTDVNKDLDGLSLQITSELDAAIPRVWQLWADPRQLEQWWGPPDYPATFVEHQFEVGGTSAYYMTSPEGERMHAWWRVTSIDAPTSLEFEEGFSDSDGTPNLDMPHTVMRVALEAQGAERTRMTIFTAFESRASMEQLLEMGMDEGMTTALGQIDAILKRESASS